MKEDEEANHIKIEIKYMQSNKIYRDMISAQTNRNLTELKNFQTGIDLAQQVDKDPNDQQSVKDSIWTEDEITQKPRGEIRRDYQLLYRNLLQPVQQTLPKPQFTLTIIY
ncbi:MAG: hypothetical protein EZS28_045931 [Streblomastix strix]|uniref:Uncharacterized protein n=1 Tax=Streblomastix strix TaxID=222440 RepID=A0A5J4TJJ6_9EUKA|nr:MAG: hypothetical protein EZS28_045931 [Streblomastix strix]